jgi:hypothetical protein
MVGRPLSHHRSNATRTPTPSSPIPAPSFATAAQAPSTHRRSITFRCRRSRAFATRRPTSPSGRTRLFTGPLLLIASIAISAGTARCLIERQALHFLGRRTCAACRRLPARPSTEGRRPRGGGVMNVVPLDLHLHLLVLVSGDQAQRPRTHAACRWPSPRITRAGYRDPKVSRACLPKWEDGVPASDRSSLC